VAFFGLAFLGAALALGSRRRVAAIRIRSRR
jgi:hypothetical protein